MALHSRFREWWKNRRQRRFHRHRENFRHGQNNAQEGGHARPGKEESPPHAQPSIPSTLFIAIAIYDFRATRPDECDFFEGDFLRVLDASSQWWRAKNFRTKQEGLIPSNYVTSDMSRSNSGNAFFDVDRLEAERKLLMPGVQLGTYLLRPCEQPGSPFCLSVRAHGVNIKHFQVFYDTNSNRFRLSSAMMFASLQELISYYQSNLIDDEVGLFEPRPQRVVPPCNFKECFISYKDVQIIREMGRGNFGVVSLGSIRSMNVAVKKSLNTTNDEAFREEARVMHILSHPRIVRFLGFCCDAPDGRAFIITEYMPNGALLDYLHTAAGRSLTYQHLISIIDQVVKAMVYLEVVRVVHRDLRAANVLVDADGSVKVADFGLTKIFDLAQNFTEGAFSFRWTAPEAMVDGYEPNIKADVWSFGVLMFEVLTYGKLPFEGYGCSQLQNFLWAGGRLPSPRSLGFQCEDLVYDIMKSCWELRPEMRPSFQILSHNIEQSIIYREGSYDLHCDAMAPN
ncbi:Tyrosine-protein kinase Lyn [Taenia solium]|eukprot:TsM_000324200 transcript=TsM_000324200 gene=TsM_000324200